MLRKLFVLTVIFFTIPLTASQPNKFHFYNYKKVVTVEGKILDFKIEEVYKRKSKFFFLYIKTVDNKKIKIEVCPEWFFNFDIAKGMKIRVKGSDLGEDGNFKYIIAKELEFGGNKITLRDKFGFPLWRGKNPHRFGFGEKRRRGRGGEK